MTVSQEVILCMARDNSTIATFERADVLTYKYFTVDFNYLQFVINKFRETGAVTVGELCIQFPEFPTDFSGASEDVEFLLYRLKEQYVYNQLFQAVQDGQQKFPDDGIQLMGYLEEVISDLRTILPIRQDYDLIKGAKERYDKYLATSSNPEAFIPTGFQEIDKLIGGWSRTGELAAIVARMGMGKTWILIYICVAAWQAGYRCGFISIEMGKDDIGYRIDTVLSGLSNSALRRGDALDMKEYRKYLASVEGKSGIFLRSKKDFNGHITPSKIEAWIKNQELDIVFLDGIGYVETERAHSNNKSEASIITDVAEDLMAVSTGMGCPIILTAQANRDGADRSKNPGLEAVRGSDGIGINASFVTSIAYPDDTHRVLSLEVLKCRYGTTGMKFNYDWSPDVGYVNSRGEISQSGGAFYG